MNIIFYLYVIYKLYYYVLWTGYFFWRDLRGFAYVRHLFLWGGKVHKKKRGLSWKWWIGCHPPEYALLDVWRYPLDAGKMDALWSGLMKTQWFPLRPGRLLNPYFWGVTLGGGGVGWIAMKCRWMEDDYSFEKKGGLMFRFHVPCFLRGVLVGLV